MPSWLWTIIVVLWQHCERWLQRIFAAGLLICELLIKNMFNKTNGTAMFVFICWKLQPIISNSNVEHVSWFHRNTFKVNLK